MIKLFSDNDLKKCLNAIYKNGYYTFSLNNDFLYDLKKSCLSLPLTPAKIVSHQLNTNIRGDYTVWLDNNSLDENISIFLKNMENLKQNFNKVFYLGLNDFEFHFSCYHPGAFYKKHLDNPYGTHIRKLTFIIYLNETWKDGDGGELLFNNQNIIKPIIGNGIIFDSAEIEHEVLLSYKNRYAISGWFLSNY